jgi:DNA polymerase-3 subunit delta'
MFFRDVYGHENALQGLQDILRGGRPSGGYVFVGPTGVGRRTLMNAFAATLLCKSAGVEACGSCESCVLLAAGNHPDYVELVMEGSTVSVDEMREFCHQIEFSPMISARRVCVINDADAMTVQAANCFLKTLEEPPPSVVLLLRAESTDRLLKTIVSRCQAIRLGPLPLPLLQDILAERGVADADILATLSEGALGKALVLAEGAIAEVWGEMDEAVAKLRPGRALALAETLLGWASRLKGEKGRAREGEMHVLELLSLLFRRRLREIDESRVILRQLDLTYNAAEQLQHNVTGELVMRNLALSLCSA